MNPGPSAQRKSLDAFAVFTMLFLCLCWGLQQVAIKAAAPQMSPVLQVGLRSFVSAVMVAVLMGIRGVSFSTRDGTFLPGIIVGLLFGAEFVAVSTGLNYTNASHMAVFVYSAPVFIALGLHWWVPGERLVSHQWWGVGIAFVGIAVAYSGSFSVPGGSKLLLGDALGILGGILWAATTIGVRVSKLSEAPPAKTLIYQLAIAAILLLPLAWINGHFEQVTFSLGLWANLAFQTLIVAFVSYLTWFWLLRKYLASRLSVFSFLSPLFGVAGGVLLLKEPLDPRFVIGALLVLVGITLVNRTKASG